MQATTRLLGPILVLMLISAPVQAAMTFTMDFEGPMPLMDWNDFAYEGEDGGPFTPSSTYNVKIVTSTILGGSEAMEVEIGNLGTGEDDRAIALHTNPGFLTHTLERLQLDIGLESMSGTWGVWSVYFCNQDSNDFADTYVLWLYKTPGADQVIVLRYAAGVATTLYTDDVAELPLGGAYDVDIDLAAGTITIDGPGLSDYVVPFSDTTYTKGTVGVGMRNAGLETSTIGHFDNVVATYTSGLTVCAGGGDYTDIQSAVDDAFDGETIELCAGTYTGTGNRNVDPGTKNLTIRSASLDATAVTIDVAASMGDEARAFFIHGGQDHTMVIEALTIQNGYIEAPRVSPDTTDAGGIFVVNSAATLRGLILDNCYGNDVAAIGFKNATGGCIQNCEIKNCEADDDVGGIAVYGTSTGVLVKENYVHHNFASSTSGGGSFSGDTIVCENVFCFNETMRNDNPTFAWSGGVTLHGTVLFKNNTLAYNTTNGQGGGVWVQDGTPTIDRCIIAFNTAATSGAIHCTGGTPTVTCSDLYGNSPDDALCGIDGGNNSALDPLFCDGPNCDVTLRSDSPCANFVPCGQVGAWGIGCIGDPPYILSIADVGNDQGRRVRINFARSAQDSAGTTHTITDYAIYRLIGEYRLTAGRHEATIDDGPVRTLYPPGDWDFLEKIPARGEAEYNVVVETLCDSTATGICYSTFFVSALTTDPLTFFDSVPDSGYSVDNLAPAAPTNVMMTGPNELAWDPAPEADVVYWEVYESTDGILDENDVLVGTTANPEMAVPGIPAGLEILVVAVDDAGNRSEPSTITNPTGATVGGQLPANFSLAGGRPNPFRGETAITLSLPKATVTRLAVFDVTGRLVASLHDGPLSAGTHHVRWEGRDTSGRVVGSGVYFVRMVSGSFVSTKRIVKLR